MPKISYEKLIEEYKTLIRITNNVDYGDRLSVKKSNKAVDKMIKISKYISSEYPLRINEFAQLLDDDDYKTDVWVAHHIIENMNYSPEIEEKALKVIIKYSKKDTIDGLGNRIWLENWYKNKS